VADAAERHEGDARLLKLRLTTSAQGREPSFDSEVASVGLPLHCSHTKRGDRNLPDSGRSIGGALDDSTSQIGHERSRDARP